MVYDVHANGNNGIWCLCSEYWEFMKKLIIILSTVLLMFLLLAFNTGEINKTI